MENLIGIRDSYGQAMVDLARENEKVVAIVSDAKFSSKLDIFEKEFPADGTVFYTGTGCNLCANTGYRGRTGIFELLVMSEGIRKMLRETRSNTDIRNEAINEGMITMNRDGLFKVKEGITSISEVQRNVFSLN